jgi:hypothetical protein
MKNEILSKIKNLIENSKIPKNDQPEFFWVCSKMSETDLSSLYELVSTQPELMKVLFDNYKRKKNTPVTDSAAWDKIITDEKELISKIS